MFSKDFSPIEAQQTQPNVLRFPIVQSSYVGLCSFLPRFLTKPVEAVLQHSG